MMVDSARVNDTETGQQGVSNRNESSDGKPHHQNADRCPPEISGEPVGSFRSPLLRLPPAPLYALAASSIQDIFPLSSSLIHSETLNTLSRAHCRERAIQQPRTAAGPHLHVLHRYMACALVLPLSFAIELVDLDSVHGEGRVHFGWSYVTFLLSPRPLYILADKVVPECRSHPCVALSPCRMCTHRTNPPIPKPFCVLSLCTLVLANTTLPSLLPLQRHADTSWALYSVRRLSDVVLCTTFAHCRPLCPRQSAKIVHTSVTAAWCQAVYN